MIAVLHNHKNWAAGASIALDVDVDVDLYCKCDDGPAQTGRAALGFVLAWLVLRQDNVPGFSVNDVRFISYNGVDHYEAIHTMS